MHDDKLGLDRHCTKNAHALHTTVQNACGNHNALGAPRTAVGIVWSSQQHMPIAATPSCAFLWTCPFAQTLSTVIQHYSTAYHTCNAELSALQKHLVWVGVSGQQERDVFHVLGQPVASMNGKYFKHAIVHRKQIHPDLRRDVASSV